MTQFTSKNSNQYSIYYLANVTPKEAWFFVAILKSFEHVSFDRTIDTKNSLFEFYVPASTERYFLSLMDYFQKQNIVQNLRKEPNRLQDSSQKV